MAGAAKKLAALPLLGFFAHPQRRCRGGERAVRGCKRARERLQSVARAALGGEAGVKQRQGHEKSAVRELAAHAPPCARRCYKVECERAPPRGGRDEGGRQRWQRRRARKRGRRKGGRGGRRRARRTAAVQRLTCAWMRGWRSRGACWRAAQGRPAAAAAAAAAEAPRPAPVPSAPPFPHVPSSGSAAATRLQKRLRACGAQLPAHRRRNRVVHPARVARRARIRKHALAPAAAKQRRKQRGCGWTRALLRRRGRPQQAV